MLVECLVVLVLVVGLVLIGVVGYKIGGVCFVVVVDECWGMDGCVVGVDGWWVLCWYDWWCVWCW